MFGYRGNTVFYNTYTKQKNCCASFVNMASRYLQHLYVLCKKIALQVLWIWPLDMYNIYTMHKGCCASFVNMASRYLQHLYNGKKLLCMFWEYSVCIFTTFILCNKIAVQVLWIWPQV